MKMSKKIFFILDAVEKGGAGNVVNILVESLKEKYEIYVVTFMEFPIKEKMGFRYIALQGNNPVIRRSLYCKILKLRNMLYKEKPDIIISFSSKINLYTILAKVNLNGKLIICERNDPFHEPHTWLRRCIRNFSYSLFNVKYAVFQTLEAEKYFSRVLFSKTAIIENPLKENLPFWKENLNSSVIITAARLDKQKNLMMMIKAFSLFYRKHSESKLFIFGEGPLREELEKNITLMKMQECIFLPGNISNIHEKMSEARMFLLSSNYEGCSNALLEAMAIGVPVISTDHPIGGARMFIKNGENGVLVDVNDYNAMYRDKEMIYNGSDFSYKISQNSRKIRNRLNIDIIKKKWIEFIETI